MSKKNRDLKLLRKFCRELDMPKCERVYKRVKTRRGLLMPLPVNPTEEQSAMMFMSGAEPPCYMNFLADRRPGSPTRYPEAFQARLIPMCQRAFYRGAKRQLLASL